MNRSKKRPALTHQPNLYLEPKLLRCPSPCSFRQTTLSRLPVGHGLQSRNPQAPLWSHSQCTPYLLRTCVVCDSGGHLFHVWLNAAGPDGIPSQVPNLEVGRASIACNLVSFTLFHDTPTPWPIGAEHDFSNEFQRFKQIILTSIFYRLSIGLGFTSKRVIHNIHVAAVN